MSMHYRVNRRCSELSHNAVGLIVTKGKADDLYRGSMQFVNHHRTALQYPLVVSVRLLTIASSIRQKAPHDLIILYFKC